MPNYLTDLTAERLRELLSYDPNTGEFRHRLTRCSVKAGQLAGSLDSYGYLTIRVAGRRYKAHRLAWLYVYGEWPDAQVDHRSRVRSENSFQNLRKATNAQQQQNRVTAKNNTSGHPGVHWHVGQEKWLARIQRDGVRLNLGRFDSFEDAVAARTAAKALVHTFHALDNPSKPRNSNEQ